MEQRKNDNFPVSRIEICPCESLEQFARFAYALSDMSRLRVLLALKNGEQCVCILTALLGLAPSTVSKHMSILSHAGLVQYRKQSKWVYFRLPDVSPRPFVKETIDLLFACTKGDSGIGNDLSRLKKICCEFNKKRK
jgi:DNA-binding transcriptional ArsR family regulator